MFGQHIEPVGTTGNQHKVHSTLWQLLGEGKSDSVRSSGNYRSFCDVAKIAGLKPAFQFLCVSHMQDELNKRTGLKSPAEIRAAWIA